MIELFVAIFDDLFRADECRILLRRRNVSADSPLLNAVVVMMEGDGAARITASRRFDEQAGHDLSSTNVVVPTDAGAMLARTVLGVVSARNSCCTELDHPVIKELGRTLATGKSALFLMSSVGWGKQLLADLCSLPGHLIRTEMTIEDQEIIASAVGDLDLVPGQFELSRSKCEARADA